MMFDNSPPPSPTRWQIVKDHVPIALVIVGVLALFVSLHTGLFAVAVVAGGHVVLGIAGFGAAWWRTRQSAEAST